MEFNDVVGVIRELGSFGALLLSIGYVARVVWPKISSHLDEVKDALKGMATSMTSVDTRLGHIEQRIETLEPLVRAQTCRAPLTEKRV